MGHPSKGVTGSVVAVYIAGEAIGALIQTAIGDRLGRIRFMQLMCIIVTIGTAIQTGCVNIGMFLAGRVLAGIAVGGMVSTVPIYLSEISAPHHRGLIGGISGCGYVESWGIAVSNRRATTDVRFSVAVSASVPCCRTGWDSRVVLRHMGVSIRTDASWMMNLTLFLRSRSMALAAWYTNSLGYRKFEGYKSSLGQ